MSWKDKIPDPWTWAGTRWRGRRNDMPVYVFKNMKTGETKGFSAMSVQGPFDPKSSSGIKKNAVVALRRHIGLGGAQ